MRPSTLMYFMDSEGTLYGFSNRMTISATFPSSRLPSPSRRMLHRLRSWWPSAQRCGPAHAREDWNDSQPCVSTESGQERCKERQNRMKRLFRFFQTYLSDWGQRYAPLQGSAQDSSPIPVSSLWKRIKEGPCHQDPPFPQKHISRAEDFKHSISSLQPWRDIWKPSQSCWQILYHLYILSLHSKVINSNN